MIEVANEIYMMKKKYPPIDYARGVTYDCDSQATPRESPTPQKDKSRALYPPRNGLTSQQVEQMYLMDTDIEIWISNQVMEFRWEQR